MKSMTGIVFSSLLPDYLHFQGSEGGRVLLSLHPDGSSNLASKLFPSLETRSGITVLRLETVIPLLDYGKIFNERSI